MLDFTFIPSRQAESDPFQFPQVSHRSLISVTNWGPLLGEGEGNSWFKGPPVASILV